MVSINGVNYSPKIKNSVLLLWADYQKIHIGKLGDILINGLSFSESTELFCYAVNSQGGKLEPKEIHDEIDKRIECYTELVLYIAAQLNPDDTGEPKPLKKGRTKG